MIHYGENHIIFIFLLEVCVSTEKQHKIAKYGKEIKNVLLHNADLLNLYQCCKYLLRF